MDPIIKHARDKDVAIQKPPHHALNCKLIRWNVRFFSSSSQWGDGIKTKLGQLPLWFPRSSPSMIFNGFWGYTKRHRAFDQRFWSSPVFSSVQWSGLLVLVSFCSRHLISSSHSKVRLKEARRSTTTVRKGAWHTLWSKFHPSVVNGVHVKRDCREEILFCSFGCGRYVDGVLETN